MRYCLHRNKSFNNICHTSMYSWIDMPFLSDSFLKSSTNFLNGLRIRICLIVFVESFCVVVNDTSDGSVTLFDIES